MKQAGVGNRTRRLVALYVSGPQAVVSLSTPSSLPRPILVISRLASSFDSFIWQDAIARVQSSPSLNLGVAPLTPLASPSVRRFGAMLPSGPSHGDNRPPSRPAVSVQSVSPSSIAITWQPSRDNVGDDGYGHNQNRKMMATLPGTK